MFGVISVLPFGKPNDKTEMLYASLSSVEVSSFPQTQTDRKTIVA